jgi:hypothetical protein
VPYSELRLDGRYSARQLAADSLAPAPWAEIARCVESLADAAHGLARGTAREADSVHALNALGVVLARHARPGAGGACCCAGRGRRALWALLGRRLALSAVWLTRRLARLQDGIAKCHAGADLAPCAPHARDLQEPDDGK